MRSRGIQAFWAMHVEAMNWSGMSVREYAAAQSLLPTSLKKWRDRLREFGYVAEGHGSLGNWVLIFRGIDQINPCLSGLLPIR